MASAGLREITEYCDRLLNVESFPDYERAHNGLQVENRGRVRRIAAAVDATIATVKLAVYARADLMIVHHGLFWSSRHPWTKRNYELIRLLIDNNLAVYSAHLPLDAHPKFGNNARLCAQLGFKRRLPFFLYKDRPIGFRVRTRISREEIAARLAVATGQGTKLIPGGPTICANIGIVTGGAGGDLVTVAKEGCDTFITGEGPHWTFGEAEELGLNVFYAGHYATETFGVKALAEHLSRKFEVPWAFLDHPSGL